MNAIEKGRRTTPGNPKGNRFAVSLGGNLGDRLAHLRSGVAALERHAEDLVVSSVYETDPVGYADQPLFLNACCIGRTRLSPRQLLSELQDAERQAGRKRGGPRYAARRLDLDLLLYSDLVMDEEGLTIPHPRLRERAFVLVPLSEIAGNWKLPPAGGNEGVTVGEQAVRVERTGVRKTELKI